MFEERKVLTCNNSEYPWIFWGQRGYSWPIANRNNGFDLPATHVPVPTSLKGIPLHKWGDINISSLLKEQLPPDVSIDQVTNIGFMGIMIMTGGTTYTGDVTVSMRGKGEDNENLPGTSIPRYYWQSVCTPRTGVRMPINGVVKVVDGVFQMYVAPVTNGAWVYMSEYAYPAGPTFGLNLWLSHIYLTNSNNDPMPEIQIPELPSENADPS